MATFNNLSLTLVKEKGLLVYVERQPSEVWRALLSSEILEPRLPEIHNSRIWLWNGA